MAWLDTGSFSFQRNRPLCRASKAIKSVISFDIEAGGNAMSARFAKSTVPEF
jgi:hypothetical protein